MTWALSLAGQIRMATAFAIATMATAPAVAADNPWRGVYRNAPGLVPPAASAGVDPAYPPIEEDAAAKQPAKAAPAPDKAMAGKAAPMAPTRVDGVDFAPDEDVAPAPVAAKAPDGKAADSAKPANAPNDKVAAKAPPAAPANGGPAADPMMGAPPPWGPPGMASPPPWYPPQPGMAPPPGQYGYLPPPGYGGPMGGPPPYPPPAWGPPGYPPPPQGSDVMYGQGASPPQTR